MASHLLGLILTSRPAFDFQAQYCFLMPLPPDTTLIDS